jgi:hypothetical protein
MAVLLVEKLELMVQQWWGEKMPWVGKWGAL